MTIKSQAVETRRRGIEQTQPQEPATLQEPLGFQFAVHRHQRTFTAAHELPRVGRRHPPARDGKVLEDRELLARRGYFGNLVELTPHHEEARHPQEDLLGHQPVQVGVIPEGAGRVVLGNLEAVGQLLPFGNLQEDVVGIPSRRHVQPVKMQVRGLRQGVGEPERHLVPGPYFQPRTGHPAAVTK